MRKSYDDGMQLVLTTLVMLSLGVATSLSLHTSHSDPLPIYLYSAIYVLDVCYFIYYGWHVKRITIFGLTSHGTFKGRSAVIISSFFIALLIFFAYIVWNYAT